MSRKLIHGILIGMAAAAFSLLLWYTGCLDWLEHPIWDWRVRLMAKPAPTTDKIRLIYLDQSDLDWGKDERHWAWPWPRVVYTTVLDFCRRGGAKAVVFDMLFTEPSDQVENDQAFGESLARTTGSAAGLMLSSKQGTTRAWPKDMVLRQPTVDGLGEYLTRHPSSPLIMTRAAFPIPEVATNCSMVGDVYAAPDSDKIIRRTPLFRVFDGHFVPTLGLAALCASQADSKIRIDGDSLLIGSTRVPLDQRGNAILSYRGTNELFNNVSAQAVIQSELRLRTGGKPVLDPEYFRDCYVFFAATAPALLDLRATPLSSVSPGVIINATALDNILSNDFLRDATLHMVLLSTIFFALFAGLLGRFCEKGWHSAAGFVILLPLPIAQGFALYAAGIWMPVATQESAVAVALVGALITNYAVEGRQKRFVKNAFKQYLSPVIIERLTEHPEQLKLGGEKRELTIFFSDVRGFTTISEGLEPEKLTSLLNDYLSPMSDIIMDQGGYIDKYEGDAIIAFWNAPLDLPDHASCGVRSALLCQAKLAEIRPALKSVYGKDVFARIGVNTGKVVIGNMGSTKRFNYTFLGDAGNLASRLEGINKQFGTSIMISEHTARLLGDEFALREISLVTVVGKAEPIRVYTPLFKHDFNRQTEVFEQFDAGLKLFYAGNFQKALETFGAISDKDAPAGAYLRQCRNLVANPPEKWAGVWEITEK
jgi:adenylate cyclase